MTSMTLTLTEVVQLSTPSGFEVHYLGKLWLKFHAFFQSVKVPMGTLLYRTWLFDKTKSMELRSV